MKRIALWALVLPVLLLAGSLLGCSQSAPGAVPFNELGQHPKDWIAMHGASFSSNPDQCVTCHGSYSDPLTSGGISQVSCFSGSRNGQGCHASGPGGHPAGWDAPGQHGRLGAMAPPLPQSGFAYCTVCHGSTYTNASTRSCLACHTKAPHPNRPWRGTTPTGTNHIFTDGGNAPECAKCHTNGANSTLIPTPPAPAGTAPGCFNNTLCHGSNVAPPHVASPSYLAPLAHGPDAKSNLGTCQACHATPASGANPRFTVVKNNLASGCETCHAPNTAHPTPWLPGRGTTQGTANTATHATAANIMTSCTPCHGNSLNGGNAAVAPSCMGGPNGGVACHVSSPGVTPRGCTSCHGNPPSGTVSPDRGFSHGSHGFPNVPCSACHTGAGAGTSTHGTGTPTVVMPSAYQAKSGGTATYTPATFTCSNVSCHGGQTTPSWRETNAANLIDVNTQCTKCHTYGTGQNNGFSSGEHNKHVNGKSIACTKCHNTTTLAATHFTTLSTAAMEGPAAGTIGGGSTSIPSANWNASTKRCGPTCHGTETW